jgi:hypothetical protein
MAPCSAALGDPEQSGRGSPFMQMRKLLLAASLVSLLGCADAASPGDLAISVTLNRASMRPGDTLGVSVTVLNVGDRPYTLNEAECGGPFEIMGPNGDRVASDQFCAGTGMALSLERGQSYTFQFAWPGETSRYTGGKFVKTPVDPGSYAIRGKVKIQELGVIVGGGLLIYIGP